MDNNIGKRALLWWDNLNFDNQLKYLKKYGYYGLSEILSEHEIEGIYKHEIIYPKAQLADDEQR
jgi:hypothetical protein